MHLSVKVTQVTESCGSKCLPEKNILIWMAALMVILHMLYVLIDPHSFIDAGYEN